MASFHYRDFRLFIASKLFSMTAFHMVLVAIAYQIYDLTGDPMDLAYIGLAMFGPAIGFSLITGYVSDLVDRRLVMAVCFVVMLLSACFFFLFTTSGTSLLWPVYVILFLYGTGRAFYQPASNSLVPNLVPVETFPNAVAWNIISAKTAQIIGPAAGGLLYGLGPEVVYGTAAITFAMATITMILIRPRPAQRSKEPPNFRILFAGIRYIWTKKILLGAISLDMFAVLMGGVTALLPIYAKDILDIEAGNGLLRSAIAVGSVISAFVMTRTSMDRAVGRILFISVIVFGLATIAFSVSTWLVLSITAMVVLGAADMLSVFIRSTLLQIATPDDMRGRVSAVNSVFTGASNELGEFRAGVMAAWIGAVPAAVVGGVGAVVIAGIFWKLFPELARVERMDRNLL